MQTVEMKACAHCGGSNLKDGFIRATDEVGWFFVECECGAQVHGPTAKNAHGLWNTRFEASPPPSAPVDAERGRGPRCESCLKPVEVGQVVLCYDDAGEMHADCEHPYSTKHEQRDGEPAPVVLLGEPMVHVPLAALALPPSGKAEMVREMCAAKADQNATSCQREAECRLSGPEQMAWSRAAEEISMTASAIRSLDLSNKGVG